MSAAEEFETFALDEVCALTGAPSPDWLYRRIASGELTAVLAGRSWRMTRSDMVKVVDLMRAAAERELAERAERAERPTDRPATGHTATRTAAPSAAGLSKRSAARMKRRQLT